MSNFWKIFISVIVTFLIVGGGIFYVMQRQINNIQATNQTKMDDLNKQIATLKSTSSTTAPSTSTTPATTDVTATWKTYTNSIYGFSVKYPATETPRVINAANVTVDFEITPNSGDGQSVSFYQTSKSLATIVAGAKADMPSGFSVSSSSITIGGETATKLIITKNDNSQSPGINIYVIHGGSVYEIISDQSDTNFDSFLSTFKFTK